VANFIERGKFTCALGGALTTVKGLNKVVPIVHSAAGCATSLAIAYSAGSGQSGSGYCGAGMTPTSSISEYHIVFGGEKRLEEQIENTLKIIEGDLFIVLTGCQVEIIGDDALSIADKFQDQNVIGVNTPGFLGNTFKGYDAVLKVLVDKIIEKADEKEEKTINILGVVPGHDAFYRGNLDEIKRLLSLIGVKVNTFFGTDETVESIKGYGKAALNVVLSEQAGVDTAQEFEKIHGIPYILLDTPIGPDGTNEFLRTIGSKLKISEELIESVIASEKKYYYSYISRSVDIYADNDLQKYTVIAADSYYAYPLTRFLANDFGWITYLVSINDVDTEKEQQKYLKKFDNITSETKPIVEFHENASDILKSLRRHWPSDNNQKYYDAFSPAFVVGSVIEKSLASTINAKFLSVAFPVSDRVVLNKFYTGYRGALNLVEELLTKSIEIPR